MNMDFVSGESVGKGGPEPGRAVAGRKRLERGNGVNVFPVRVYHFRSRREDRPDRRYASRSRIPSAVSASSNPSGAHRKTPPVNHVSHIQDVGTLDGAVHAEAAEHVDLRWIARGIVMHPGDALACREEVPNPQYPALDRGSGGQLGTRLAICHA